MILRRLELKHFGRFADCAFDFRRGLNLVSGPSDSGKTTLAESIPCILFGSRDRHRFRPWGGGAGCAAVLVFEDAGRTLRIERDLLTDQVSLKETDAEGRSLHHFSGQTGLGDASAAGDAYRAELVRYFGLGEEALFRFGQFFEQGYASRFAVEGGAGEWATLLANMSASEPSAALGDGTELETVRRRLAELERLWFDTRKALAETVDLSEKIAGLEASIEADRADFAQGGEYLDQVRQGPEEAAGIAPLAAGSGEHGVLTDLHARRLHLERELAKTGLPGKMPAELPGVLVQADEIRQEMIAIQKEAAGLRQQLLKRPSPSWRPAALTTLLSVLSVATIAWLNPPWLLAGLAASGLATAAGWAVYLWRLARERQERNRLKQPLKALEERREEAQARLTGLDDSFSRMGLSPSAVEIVRMQKNLERHLRLQQELAEVEIAMGAADSGEKAATVDASAKHRSAGTEEFSTSVIPKAAATLDGAELAAAEAALAALADRLQRQEREFHDLTRQAADRIRLEESLRRIEEEGETLRRRESELVRQPVVASPAATGRLSPSALTQLAADVGQTLATLTADRYTMVRLEEAGAWSLRGADGEWHPLKYFSRGTTEFFCLALRLNLGRRLAGDRRLPVILDDALAGFDQARLTEVVKLLERLAGEQQVILLSRDEVLRKRANRERWHTVTLTTESTNKPTRSQERNDDDGQLHLL